MAEKKACAFKKGRGNQSNSAAWAAAYNKKHGIYVAKLYFSSAAGIWRSMYEITEKCFEQLGTFENDDYLSEELIKKGRCLYRFENERSYPEPLEMVYDDNYAALCKVLKEL